VDVAEREAVWALIHRLEQRWNRPIPASPRWHAYDPLPFWEFLAGVAAASALTAGRRFLDLGCGIGSKLAIMHALGWRTRGVDHYRPYDDAARDLIPEAVVAHLDIFKLDDLDADLVYMYRPAKPDTLQALLEAHVLRVAQPGTVMFWPLRHDPEVWVV
jgi:hypothetical protein